MEEPIAPEALSRAREIVMRRFTRRARKSNYLPNFKLALLGGVSLPTLMAATPFPRAEK